MANGFKTGGRKLGTPNKRQKISKRIDDFIERGGDETPQTQDQLGGWRDV